MATFTIGPTNGTTQKYDVAYIGPTLALNSTNFGWYTADKVAAVYAKSPNRQGYTSTKPGAAIPGVQQLVLAATGTPPLVYELNLKGQITLDTAQFYVVGATTPPPTNLRQTAGTSSSNTLAWDAVAGTYALERATVTNGVVGSFSPIYTGTTASYQDMGLTFMTVYAYRVMVVAGTVASVYSAVLQLTTAAAGPWANAEIFTVGPPVQSNGQGYSPFADLTSAQIAAATSDRVGIWNKATGVVEKYQIGVNDQGIPDGVTPGYGRGFGIDVGFVTNWLADSANSGKKLVLWKPYVIPPPGTNTNGAGTAYWNSTLKTQHLADYQAFAQWMVGQNYSAPISITSDLDIGEQDSFENNTNFTVDLTNLVTYFVNGNVYNATTRYIVPLLQRAAGTQHDDMINVAKQSYVLNTTKSLLLSISNPVFFDGTHFVAESMFRRGQECYRLSRVSLAPTATSFFPNQQVVGGTVELTGTNFKSNATVKVNGLTASSVTVVSDTKLTFVVPTGATSGSIFVTTDNGTTSVSGFVIGNPPTVGAPTITGMTPTTGAVGTSVYFTGTNLSGATAKLNGVTAMVGSSTSTQVVLAVPAGATTGTFVLTTAGGSVTSGTFTVPVTAYSLGDDFERADGSVGNNWVNTENYAISNGMLVSANNLGQYPSLPIVRPASEASADQKCAAIIIWDGISSSVDGLAVRYQPGVGYYFCFYQPVGADVNLLAFFKPFNGDAIALGSTNGGANTPLVNGRAYYLSLGIKGNSLSYGLVDTTTGLAVIAGSAAATQLQGAGTCGIQPGAATRQYLAFTAVSNS